MILSTAQIESYQNNGFLIIPDFVAAQDCDQLMDEARRLVSEFEPKDQISFFSTTEQAKLTTQYFLDSGDKIHFFFEPDAYLPNGKLRQEKNLSINKMGHALHDLNPVFNRFSRRDKIKVLCQEIGFTHPLLIQSMYIFKQPRIGGEVISHQDRTFIYTEPDSVVGFWFALEDARATNGCLYALPGGHKLSLKRRFVRDGKGGVHFQELDPTPLPEDGYVPLEAKKGSLVLLHGHLPHRSGPNQSDSSRHAYTLHIIEGSSNQVHYPENNWLQRGSHLPVQGF